MRQTLFADNDPDFLETRSEFLEKAGYKIFRATSIAEAEGCLREIWTPVAILDIRLIDDDDEKDQSGVAFAKNELCRGVTKIILTNFPTNIVSELIAIASGDGPQVIDVLHKQDGPERLIQTLEKALNHHVRINWNITPDWKGTNAFALVSLIEPGLEGERLVNRAEEIEDLFRRLFYEKDRIRIERVLWQRNGRVALTVFAFKGGAMDPFVVVCGQNALVTDEANRVRNLAPKVPGETSTTLADNAETTHFAANAYALGTADLENIRSLAEVYRAGDKKLFAQAVEALFQETLAAWQQGTSLPAERALEELYREELGLVAERISPRAFQVRFHALTYYLPVLGKMISDPERIAALLQAFAPRQLTLKIKSPGRLAGESILVDANGRPRLTDFGDASDVPQFWNFVALESIIRFDWVEEKNMQSFRDIEDRLLDDDHFGRPDPQGIEPSAQKVVRSIQAIRRYAGRAVGKEYLQYHLGIFFHAARRIADFDPAITPTPNEQARLAHALMAMAMIAAKVEQAERDIITAPKGERGLRIDKDGVKRDGKRISIRGQGYDLLRYLATPPNQLRTRRDIVENVLKEQFDERDENQSSRVHVAVRRLREKIEDDPDHPRYLVAESGGYRLLLHPEE